MPRLACVALQWWDTTEYTGALANNPMWEDQTAYYTSEHPWLPRDIRVSVCLCVVGWSYLNIAHTRFSPCKCVHLLVSDILCSASCFVVLLLTSTHLVDGNHNLVLTACKLIGKLFMQPCIKV